MANKKTKEEIIIEIDQKIAYHQGCIKTLEDKKKKLLSPKPDARKIARLIKESGLTLEEIADRLGVRIDE